MRTAVDHGSVDPKAYENSVPSCDELHCKSHLPKGNGVNIRQPGRGEWHFLRKVSSAVTQTNWATPSGVSRRVFFSF